MDKLKIKSIINTAKGLESPDVAILNGSVVDVTTGKIFKANVYLKEDRVAFVSEDKYDVSGDNTLVIDASNMYVAPGFIDSHAHIESSLMIPSLFGYLLLKEGTTTSIVDPHEVANVAGIDAIKAMLSDMEISPIKFIIQVPTCVPPEPELETSGDVLNALKVKELVEELMSSSVFAGLGEVMSYKKILEHDVDLSEKLKEAYEMGLVIDGHSADIVGQELQAYAASKISTDHCARKGEEIIERLRSGLYVQIQRRRGESDFQKIVSTLREMPSVQRTMWCTDDAEADEIWLGEHTIRSVVKEAIELSLDPIKAIQMATINVAQAYRVDSEIGLIAPGRYADILIFKSIDKMDIDSVLINGAVVFRNGKYLIGAPQPHTDLEKFKGNTLSISISLEPADLVPKAEPKSGSAVVNILTVERTVTRDILPINEGVVMADSHRDIAWICVINRYGKGGISRGFIKGTGIKAGAFASSVSHDTHNIVIIGTDINDMYRGFVEIQKSGGGMVFVNNGIVESEVELPYFGLMSSDHTLPKKLLNLKEKLYAHGVKVPLKKLMFFTLTVGRGGYAITDKGLVDYKAKKTVPIITGYV